MWSVPGGVLAARPSPGTRPSDVRLHAVLLLVLGSCAAPGPELMRGRWPTPRRADAIVVLGNRPPRRPDGTIAPELARRVRRGVELHRRGLAPRLLMTGGPAPDGSVEADVMAAEAMRLGVPASAIARERASRDTVENARLGLAVLCGDGPCRPRILLVSTPYHLRRAGRLFRCAGAEVIEVPSAAPPDRGTRLLFTAHEYAAGIFGRLTDACARAARAVAY
jgi:uncharacterized SAM-binding protein YcdF (DUF218 family)